MTKGVLEEALMRLTATAKLAAEASREGGSGIDSIPALIPLASEAVGRMADYVVRGYVGKDNGTPNVGECVQPERADWGNGLYVSCLAGEEVLAAFIKKAPRIEVDGWEFQILRTGWTRCSDPPTYGISLQVVTRGSEETFENAWREAVKRLEEETSKLKPKRKRKPPVAELPPPEKPPEEPPPGRSPET